MKKLGFLLLALTVNTAVANPQASSLPTTVAVTGADVSWARESTDKRADAQQLSALNNATLSIGQMINDDLNEKISQRLNPNPDLQ